MVLSVEVFTRHPSRLGSHPPRPSHYYVGLLYRFFTFSPSTGRLLTGSTTTLWTTCLPRSFQTSVYLQVTVYKSGTLSCSIPKVGRPSLNPLVLTSVIFNHGVTFLILCSDISWTQGLVGHCEEVIRESSPYGHRRP